MRQRTTIGAGKYINYLLMCYAAYCFGGLLGKTVFIAFLDQERAFGEASLEALNYLSGMLNIYTFAHIFSIAILNLLIIKMAFVKEKTMPGVNSVVAYFKYEYRKSLERVSAKKIAKLTFVTVALSITAYVAFRLEHNYSPVVPLSFSSIKADRYSSVAHEILFFFTQCSIVNYVYIKKMLLSGDMIRIFDRRIKAKNLHALLITGCSLLLPTTVLFQNWFMALPVAAHSIVMLRSNCSLFSINLQQLLMVALFVLLYLTA